MKTLKKHQSFIEFLVVIVLPVAVFVTITLTFTLTYGCNTAIGF